MQWLFSFLSMFIFQLSVWETDFEKAKQEAKAEHKCILLSFSGSDWCGPCIRLHKQVFDTPDFKSYTEENLVLVNADFPRLKKNKLSKQQQKKNEALAEVYNKEGAFPLTVLLNADGKLLRKWDGVPAETAEEFVSMIKEIVDANK